MNIPDPICLRGNYASVEPLKKEHLEGLIAAVSDGELWKLWFTPIPSPDEMITEMERRWALEAQDIMRPFIIRRLDTEAICGMTTFTNIEPDLQQLEIGYTWYSHSAQRTAINTEVKLLMLTCAFETMHCKLVKFRTHKANSRSQAALVRIGAREDTELQQRLEKLDDGFRDRLVFTIQASHWPEVKLNLQQKLER